MTKEKETAEAWEHRITTEEEARNWFWRYKFQGRSFACPYCAAESFYPITKRPEVRQCKGCDRQVRLRSGTFLESSKISLLVWAKAISCVTQSKQPISASTLQRQLGLQSYGTTWSVLQKIKGALRNFDENINLIDASSGGSSSAQKQQPLNPENQTKKKI